MAAELVGKASQDMIKELQKVQQEQIKDQGKAGGEGGAKFDKAMQNHANVSETQNLQKVQDAQKSSPTLQAAKSQQINNNLGVNANDKVSGVQKPENSSFKGVVKDLMQGQNKMEDLMKMAMGGGQLSNQEMIGIQAGVYMFSQQMELTSKVIEKATSAIKQTMNTQL